MMVVQQPVPPDMLKAMQCAVKACDKKPLTNEQKQEVQAAGKKACAKLGEIKHACVEEKMEKEKGCRTERTYDMSKRPPRVVTDSSGQQTQGYLAAKKAIVAAGMPLVKGRYKRPDAMFGNRAPYHIFDAKFPCSKKVKSGNLGSGNVMLSARGVSGASMMGATQQQAYQKIADGKSKGGGTVTAVSPADGVGVKC